MINFLAQTGPFTIPLKCTTKKCDVSLVFYIFSHDVYQNQRENFRFCSLHFQLSIDKAEVDFGTSVIGETLSRSITLTNKGALATKFEFYKITGEQYGFNTRCHCVVPLVCLMVESVASYFSRDEAENSDLCWNISWSLCEYMFHAVISF